MELTRLDDQALMQLIGRAHHGALGELYDRYCRLVYSVAYGATNDPHLAEEITQDTFLRVWQRAESFSLSPPLDQGSAERQQRQDRR